MIDCIHPKWIIEGNHLRLGNMEIHSDLATNGGRIEGGGFWYIHEQNQTLYLYGSSIDFGQCSIELVKKVYSERNADKDLFEYKWVFSTYNSLKYAMEDGVVINGKV